MGVGCGRLGRYSRERERLANHWLGFGHQVNLPVVVVVAAAVVAVGIDSIWFYVVVSRQQTGQWIDHPSLDPLLVADTTFGSSSTPFVFYGGD